MGTRATYTIKNTHNVTSTLYIHWDGYLEGAATYFYAAMTNASAREANGGFAEQILRAVPGAEITHGPEAHGDTEFHYEIDADMSLRASKWIRENDKRKLTPCFIGDIFSFINRYNELIENFQPFKPVTQKYGRTRWLNLAMAKHDIEGRYGDLTHLRIWSKNPELSRESANWKGCVEGLRNMIEAFPELMTEEIQGFLA
jgi:hypothetical protein